MSDAVLPEAGDNAAIARVRLEAGANVRLGGRERLLRALARRGGRVGTAAAGARSRATRVSARPVLWLYSVSTNPPPTPMLCGFTTPSQSSVATAASTALPPRSSVVLWRRRRIGVL